jgi:HK97 family phage prohead protease
METRIFKLSELEVRQSTDDEPAVIIGLPAVYNERSENLGGFVEIIEPGFFENVLGPEEDTRALQNHDPNYVLGRKSASTLSIDDSARGPRVQIIPPETQYARDLITVMNRGDVKEMSFAFNVKQGGDEWSRTEEGIPLRTLKRGGCHTLPDVSVVTFPAYPATSAEVRAIVEEMTDTDGDDGQASTVESDETQTDSQGQARRLTRAKIDLEIAKRK